MRMALCASATHARQIDLDRRRFEEFKNFANKIWNGARFVFMNLEGLSKESLAHGLDSKLFTLEDRWILSLLNRIIKDVGNHLNDYAFDRAATSAYEFFWKEFCAYYLELVKPVLFGKSGTAELKENKQKILFVVLLAVVRLLHPMAPFITEELFQLLKQRFDGLEDKNFNPYLADAARALKSPACIVAPFPVTIQEKDIDETIEKTFAFMDGLTHAVRNIRAEMQLPPNAATDLFIIGSSRDPERKLAEENQAILNALVRLHKVTFAEKETPLAFSANALVGNLKLIVPLPEEMREREKVRLTKERDKILNEQIRAREQLANSGFIEKAPPQLVEKIRSTLLQSEKQLAEIMKKLEVQ